MKKVLKWIGWIGGISFCGLAVFAVLWLRQYQVLSDEESEIVLTPDIADITFCTMEGVPLGMDMYFPETIQETPAQVLVYVHGGSFTSGDKRKGSGITDIPAMTARGFAVAAVNYRLMPEHPFPAAVQDAKCAIRYLRVHAREYNLNADKIGIWGGSAGGHLAALVGLTGGEQEFEAGEYLDQSSAVAAVVEMFGPTDLTLAMDWMQRLLLNRAFNTSDSSAAVLQQASPVNYITGDEPPFLILHGEQDSAVPLAQAQTFYQKLINAGVDTRLVVVKNANHNFKPTGGAIQPGRTEISALVADFFADQLR
jgi:acetyl esterase/lipase